MKQPIGFKTVYFQPPGIKKQYCEIGMILENDSNYIHYMEEPCKILKDGVKIIEKENVTYDKKTRTYTIKSNSLGIEAGDNLIVNANDN